mmetsp:Transcript_21071/g.30920  ORF Transcript_21071/g.30920 Transcript_21071/m.30920 type:complete len:217 (+) Transcript_21071:141-791(+)|eukprot:CAMPEP_0195522664 /NCGR_PEP_ID=MMETSP0794_2-20130614/21037_1 /TAXON_ID=515487 /ORGANISM="Stephanopyxis turris, Strain CCMP 815" /LENGTH=216 /DNA_ID=CAMNT_0040652467 /DNA_START=123 /DNA_END=773 /DNA_ORIENTATION=+
MKASMRGTASIAVATVAVSVSLNTADGFAFVSRSHRAAALSRQCTVLQMGLFDGIKDAFSAPALERSTLDEERETPIDRWMGWNVKSEEGPVEGGAAPAGFIDAMDEQNYISTSLPKPMGIVFEENDSDTAGIFVLSLSEGGEAEQDGTIKPGDQLVAVNDKKVTGASFDESLGAIVDSQAEKTKLIFFRGDRAQLYGPTGASQEWLDEFVAAHTN